MTNSNKIWKTIDQTNYVAVDFYMGACYFDVDGDNVRYQVQVNDIENPQFDVATIDVETGSEIDHIYGLSETELVQLVK